MHESRGCINARVIRSIELHVTSHFFSPKAMAQAPRSLENLLTSLKPELASLDAIDQLIKDHAWTGKFRQYLASHQLEEEIIILKFLIAFTQLERLSTELKTCKKAKAIQIQDQAFRLMREILHHYFNADEYMLPLSNSKLQDSLEEKLQDCHD